MAEMDIIKAVADVGFPAFVALYVLVRVNHNIEDLTKSVTGLTIALNSFLNTQKNLP